jgi:predicted amino acid-binding ACT domain protein
MRAIITVIGRDMVGIIARVSATLSQNNVNILDISQSVLQDYFAMVMLVDLSAATAPFAQLQGSPPPAPALVPPCPAPPVVSTVLPHPAVTTATVNVESKIELRREVIDPF